MAGDWLKFEKSTLDKPEVYELAGILGIEADAVIGKLLRVWNWFDDQSRDGNAPVTLTALLDRYAGVTGFVDAMKSVGWMQHVGSELVLPKFDRHNGNTAKKRALGKNRAESSRKRNANSNDTSVTKALPEKRRKEKSNTPISPKGENLSLEIQESEKTDPIKSEVGKLLGRRQTTKWSAEETKLLKSILPIHPDDMALMKEFYAASLPKSEDFRRTSLERLLKYWNGELDKARAWRAQNR